MTNKKLKKQKRDIPLRPRGEVIQTAERPSKTLFEAVLKAEQELSANAPAELPETTEKTLNPLPPPPTTTHHHIPHQETDTPPDIIEHPISPKSDYFKTTNEEIDQALRLGLFKGTSYETYKILYRQTRGHVSQRRSFKVTNTELERLAGVSHNTLRKHLKWLEADNWIKKTHRIGDNTGVEIEVRIYAEIKHTFTTPTTTPYHPLLPFPSTTQKLGGGDSQKLVGGGRGISPINIEENASLKTLFKTNTIDDEAIEVFNKFCREVTGRDLTENDRQNFKEVFQILGEEMLRVRGRTASISSFTGVLIAHLKSVFADKPKIKPETLKKDIVGKKSDEFNFEKELQILRELVEIDGIEVIIEKIDSYEFADEVKEKLKTELRRYAEESSPVK